MATMAQVNYAVSGNKAYVTNSPDAAGNIVIASTYEGYPVISIGIYAFLNCASVTSVAIPDSVTDIGGGAFYFCSDLTNITIPNSVGNVEDYAFGYCFSLTNIAFPDSVTNIGDDVFYDCSGLTNITVAAGNLNYSSTNGVLFNKNQTTLIQYPAGLTNASYTISDDVKSIGDVAFSSCANLTNVIIPNSVTNIGDEAFGFCSGLTDMTVPNGVTRIGSQVFFNCTSLSSITISASVTDIGQYAFNDCTSLTNITIPGSVTSIEDNAFGYCSALTSVFFQGNAPVADPTTFSGDTNVTVYYLPGTTGWSSTLGDFPTAFWFLPNPLILNFEPNFGLHGNQFNFTISWATNASVVVEACASLSNPVWLPLSTNVISADVGAASFSDSQWANYPDRYYRLRSP